MVTRSLPSLFTPSSPSVRTVLRNAWSRVGAMMQARATRRLLLEMDPHMMADIGIGRGEAMQEANRPFWDVDGR